MSLASSPVLENSPWHPPGWFLPQICPFKWQRKEVRDQGTLTLSYTFSHLESWKWLNISPTPGRAETEKKQLLARIGELHDKSMNRCRILHTKQMTASPCKASRMKLLANEREQVWISMSAARKGKEQRCKIYKQMLNFMYKNDDKLLQNILSQKYFFDWSKRA